MLWNRTFWPVVALVVVTSGVLKVSSALIETQTYDEGIHLVTGYCQLTLGRDLTGVFERGWRESLPQPPLPTVMSALPLLALRPELPIGGAGFKESNVVKFGLDFLYGNRVGADTMLFAGRSMTMLLSLLFLVALAWWTRRRFGVPAALLAVVMCAFDPNLIAHGRYITADFPVTVLFFFACVLWAEYLENGGARLLWLAAFVFALAQVTKFSAVSLGPIFLALYAASWARRPDQFPLRRIAVAAGAVLTATCVTITVVYWPDTLRYLTAKVPPLSDFMAHNNPMSETLFRLGRWFHLPDHAYLLGLGGIAEQNAEGHSSYLLGVRSAKGWWYYFPVVFAVKSTVAALAATALLIAAVAWMLARRMTRDFVRRVRAIPPIWIGLLFPPLFLFAACMTSNIDLGVRYILPVYPFLYVSVAALLSRARAHRVAGWAMVVLGMAQIVEAASIAPDYLAFFNVLAGGPGNGPKYLVDSNIDWGQDVKKLARWLDAHGTHRAWVSYFGNALPGYYGIEAIRVPAPGDRKGWDAIDGYVVASVTSLHGVYTAWEDLAPLRMRNPIAKVGWSLYVYDFRKPKTLSPREGQLVRRPGETPEDGKIYLVRDGIKHWVLDAKWLMRHGYHWPGDVIVIPAAELDSIPLGDPIRAESP